MKVYRGNLENSIIIKGNGYGINHEIFNTRNRDDVDAIEINKYVDLNSLNDLLKEYLERSRFNINKIIEKDEIGGDIYTSIDGNDKILHLSCDSDYYRTGFETYINLSSGECFIYN